MLFVGNVQYNSSYWDASDDSETDAADAADLMRQPESIDEHVKFNPSILHEKLPACFVLPQNADLCSVGMTCTASSHDIIYVKYTRWVHDHKIAVGSCTQGVHSPHWNCRMSWLCVYTSFD